MKILSKLFWRLVVPLVCAVVLTIAWMLEGLGASPGGGTGSGFSGEWDFGHILLACLFAALLVGSLLVNLRETFKWGKQAEEFEEELKEADEIEKERRRKSSWIER